MTKSKVAVVLFILIQLLLLGWASRLLTEWGTDYGVYYSGAYFLDENYRLYQEFFDHKGPVYYLFLKFIGHLIGWGHLQAVFSLYLSLLVFFLPAFFIILREVNSVCTAIFALLLTLLTLYGQPTNASIAFFHGGLLISSFYLLVTGSSSFLKIFLALVLYWLAILTRIDAMIFAPVFLWIFLKETIANGLSKISLTISAAIFCNFLIFMSLARFFDFNLNQFFEHNITFNQWYRGDKTFFANVYKPTHIEILSTTLLIPLLILINQKYKWQLSSIKAFFSGIALFFTQEAYGKRNNFTLTLILASAVCLWLISGTDKNYHVLTLSIPLIFFFWIKNESYMKYSTNFVMYFVGLFVLALAVSPPILKLIRDPQCLITPFCKSSDIANYTKTIESINKMGALKATIVGGRGWVYFFSQVKPERAINDWWLYQSRYFSTEKLMLSHKMLLSENEDRVIWIDNGLIESASAKSALFDQILAQARLIENQGRYSMYSIIRIPTATLNE